MQSILACLNEYSNLISALAATVSAAVGLSIAFLTVFIFRENRILRKVGSEPQVVAYLSPHPDGNGGVHFVLANVGRGPAFDVTFKLIYDEEDFKAHDVLLENEAGRAPISVLPQDEKQKVLLGVGYVLYGDVGKEKIPPLKPFEVQIKFRNMLGKSLPEVKQIIGLYILD